jgi:hypothetical protein
MTPVTSPVPNRRSLRLVWHAWFGGSSMEGPSPHRQQETFVSTQYVLRVEQAHPSTFEGPAFPLPRLN